MAAPTPQEPCPACGELISATAARCRFCGERLDEEEDDEPRPRRRPPPADMVEPTDFLVPIGVSGWAIASCYLGLIGFCLPVIGILFAIPAFICGVVALRKQPRGPSSYGKVTSNIRAIIGLILSGLAIVGWTVLVIIILVNK